MSDATQREELRQQLVALMATHQRSIYGYIVSLLGSRADADDVLQNTCLVIWRKADDFHGKGNFMTWACRIAYFEVLAHRKKARRGQHAGFDQAMLEQIAAVGSEMMSNANERVELLRECMVELDESSVRLLEMRYGQDMSPRQIAEQPAEKKGPGAIRAALFRIRRSLGECIRRKMGVGNPPDEQPLTQ